MKSSIQKSRGFYLFQRLKTWEVKHFQQFLDSPFFNRREDVIKLLEYLKEESEKKKPDFSRASVFKKLYPNQDYEEQKIYFVLSCLSQLLEKFLAYREMSQDPSLEKLYLAKAFRQSKMDNDFERALLSGKKILEKQPLRDSHYLRQIYDFELEYYDYQGSRSRAVENNLQKLGDTFDFMYIAEKLKQFCFQVSHQNVYQKDYSYALRQAIFKVIDEDPQYLEYPAIKIYYLCYQAITTGQEDYFQDLRKQLLLHAQKFTPTDIRDIHLAAINFCIKRMNTGEQKYIQEGFELYRAGLEGKFLLENEEISRFTFNNVVLLGLKLNKHNWVEQFISNYKARLSVPFRKSVSEYSLASLRFEQKRYKDVMRLIVSFESSDHLMNLGAKLMLLKIYYELKEWDALDSLLGSMRIYLQRKGMMGYHKDHYKKVIRITKKLIQFDRSRKAKTNLTEQIMELKVRSVQDWFLGQMKSL